ncbi:MAG: hypothetical protein D6677_02040 [Calditrichaeota bacterium]|nr:MAG: hypothetical protein D6677_02040 [Calditrichota bacterium]
MSWIKDVGDELGALNRSPRELRKFAGIMWAVTVLIAWLVYPEEGWTGGQVVMLVAWLAWLAAGLLFPFLLKFLYTAWMGLAFTLGWWVSRIVLTAIFYLLLTPLGLAGRLSGRSFLDRSWRTGAKSAWRPRSHPDTDYTKMS